MKIIAKIPIKFKLKEKVYFIDDYDEVREEKVCDILFGKDMEGLSLLDLKDSPVLYFIRSKGEEYELCEELIFKTKKAAEKERDGKDYYLQ